MGISAHLPPGLIRRLADTHPGLGRVRARLVDDLRLHPDRAARLVAALLTHAADDLGDAFLNDMGARLRRIDAIRGRIAGAIDHVLADGRLPADLDHPALSRLFDDLQGEMQGLTSARRFAETRPPDVGIQRIVDAIGPTAEAGPGWRPFEAVAGAGQGVVAPRPPGLLRDAMADMARDNPLRARIFGEQMGQHGDLLGLAVLAETESAQRAALRDLREALGPGFPPTEWAELAAAVEDLGRTGNRELAALRAAPVRAQRVADLPEGLRAAIGGDNTYLGPLAEQHPADLHALWDAWNAGKKTSDFRPYVYNEMRSGRRPALAEWQAAHDMANQHGLALLKDPAAFDPASPNRRAVEPRGKGGTDLLGIREDGELWYVDDKSQRLSPRQRAAGTARLNVSEVSAFEGRGFIANLRDDAADLEAGLARVRAEGRAPNPRAEEAAGRLRRAADALEAETAGWSDADFLDPARQARLAGILAAPPHRIRLNVTSTMGDVRGVTARIKALGIHVLPPFAPGDGP